MNFKTALARLHNWYGRLPWVGVPAATALTRLKGAAEHDYDRVVSKADTFLTAAKDELISIAHNEHQALHNALASVERRAKALLTVGVLTDTDRIESVAKLTGVIDAVR